MARQNLAEIKMRDFQEYHKVCQKLADRKKDPEHNETVDVGGQEYRLSRNDVRYINSLRGKQTARPRRDNRSQKTVWKRRLLGGVSFALFMVVFISPLFWLGPLTNLNREFSRALGGSLLLGAALSFWLRPARERTVQYGGIWRLLVVALWRNPLDNPGMLASLGAAIMYVTDWWPHFGYKIIPNVVDLIKTLIHLVTSLGG